MTSWIASATASPATRPVSDSARSIPAETPAAVAYFPSSTTRSVPVGSAPNPASCSRQYQCEVARRPFSSPAAPSSSEPEQTEVVQVVVASTARTHSSRAWSGSWASVPGPPGISSRSAESTSSSARSAVSARLFMSVRTGPRRAAVNTTSAPGIRDSTSYGPTASRAVNSSYSRKAMRISVLRRDSGGSGVGTRRAGRPGPGRRRAASPPGCRSRSCGRSPRCPRRCPPAVGGRPPAGPRPRTGPG